MSSIVKWVVSALAFAAMLFFCVDGVQAKKDGGSKKSESPSIMVEVKDAGGKPVAGAKVRLAEAKSKKTTKEAAGNAGHKKDVVAEGVTEAQGRYTFQNISDGEYEVAAHDKGEGHGREKITVDKGHTKVTITLGTESKHKAK